MDGPQRIIEMHCCICTVKWGRVQSVILIFENDRGCLVEVGGLNDREEHSRF